MSAGEWYESNWQDNAGDQFLLIDARNQNQFLGRKSTPYRDDHFSSYVKLFCQWRWNVVRRGGYDYRIEGCMLEPAIVAISEAYLDVIVAQTMQAR